MQTGFGEPIVQTVYYAIYLAAASVDGLQEGTLFIYCVCAVCNVVVCFVLAQAK